MRIEESMIPDLAQPVSVGSLDSVTLMVSVGEVTLLVGLILPQ